jgi:hypothetical protein
MCKTWDSIRIGIEIESLIRIGMKMMPIHNTGFCSWGLQTCLVLTVPCYSGPVKKILGQARFKMTHRERIVDGKKQ